MSRPRDWHRYTTWLAAEDRAIDTGLARFAARYRVATTLTSMQFTGLGQAATDGYTCALRAALAYSALESLDQALYGKAGQTEVYSDQVARSFASPRAAKLQQLLAMELTSNKTKDAVADLANADGATDVSPLAAGVRHLVFHGAFTAYGAGAAQSKSVRALLDDLAAATLQAADDALELHLDRQAIGPWPVMEDDTCPQCGAHRGQTHTRTCASARCRAHGEQLIQCMGTGKHLPGTYWGVFTGTIEAFKRGWVIEIRGRQRPDINRVTTELTWDPRTEQYR